MNYKGNWGKNYSQGKLQFNLSALYNTHFLPLILISSHMCDLVGGVGKTRAFLMEELLHPLYMRKYNVALYEGVDQEGKLFIWVRVMIL